MRTSLAEGEIENESPCDSCDHHIVGGARICRGRSQQEGGEQGRGAEKEREGRDREGEQRHAQKDQSRTAGEESRPVGEYALVPRLAASLLALGSTLRTVQIDRGIARLWPRAHSPSSQR